ncbi:hypothetical protein WICPIJ_000732 [Wickerhamomyces pijperi]|uniref:Uncharacterized protein n=1 Tax=Wickerhamomyces pijperi TaxID=599730 RepID=A0A9P8TRB5_WICPI|nr:hypothetical protein WICPIJ_000732 [Wickerhamomyces pijperi]
MFKHEVLGGVSGKVANGKELTGKASSGSVEDGFDTLFIQNGITGHGVDVSHRGHDLADALLFQVQNSTDDGNFIVVQSINTHGSVQRDQGLKPLLFVDGTMVFTQDLIQQNRNRIGDRIH